MPGIEIEQIYSASTHVVSWKPDLSEGTISDIDECAQLRPPGWPAEALEPWILRSDLDNDSICRQWRKKTNSDGGLELAIVLDIRSMRADLNAFAKAAKVFLHNPQRLGTLETQLSNAASEAKVGNRSLHWTTNIGDGPIVTIPSSNYRNCAHGAAKSMIAELSFDFRGTLCPQNDSRFVVTAGGTKVRLYLNDGADEASYHFDIHPGEPGHPMLHIQFNSTIKDIPRLHSMFAHPLDILEFTLMEIFQQKWRSFDKVILQR